MCANKTFLLLVLGLGASVAGCGFDDSVSSQEDGRTDSFIDSSRADTLAPLGGEASQLVLRLANEASFAALDVAAKLDVRAARNIVEHRDGADGVLGTADDDLFDDLDELDAIPWVGPVAFDRMLGYAQRTYEASTSEDVDRAVLVAANLESQFRLDDSEHAGLDQRAARNIVTYRRGPDGREETDDDRPFRTLEGLRGVDWVGDRAVDKLRSFVQREGYLEEIVPGSHRDVRVSLYLNRAFPAELHRIGLSEGVASKWLAHRNGEDDRMGTADDQTIGSVADMTFLDQEERAELTAAAAGLSRTFMRAHELCGNEVDEDLDGEVESCLERTEETGGGTGELRGTAERDGKLYELRVRYEKSYGSGCSSYRDTSLEGCYMDDNCNLGLAFSIELRDPDTGQTLSTSLPNDCGQGTTHRRAYLNRDLRGSGTQRRFMFSSWASYGHPDRESVDTFNVGMACPSRGACNEYLTGSLQLSQKSYSVSVRHVARF